MAQRLTDGQEATMRRDRHVRQILTRVTREGIHEVFPAATVDDLATTVGDGTRPEP